MRRSEAYNEVYTLMRPGFKDGSNAASVIAGSKVVHASAIGDEPKRENRVRSRTQWAAQFAVASELCKRGYEVSFTMGNHTPLADLMAISPKLKRMFLVDVKGLYKKNPFVVKRKETRPNLYYVFTFVPDDEVNQFFVLSQKQTNEYIRIELDRLKRPDNYPMTGILWQQAAKHENAWATLPK